MKQLTTTYARCRTREGRDEVGRDEASRDEDMCVISAFRRRTSIAVRPAFLIRRAAWVDMCRKLRSRSTPTDGRR
jgi:hypothetical protein